MNKFLNRKLLFILVISANYGYGQNVGIGTTTPNASAVLDLTSPDKGLLIPRVNLSSLTDPSPVVAPPIGLAVINTDGSIPGGKGLFYWNGSMWLKLQTPEDAWGVSGNANTSEAFNFIGTTDNKPLTFKVNNQLAGKIGTNANNNIFWGLATGFSNTSGTNNSFMGTASFINNNTESNNAGLGYGALQNNIFGNDNTAIGNRSLFANVAKDGNTAIGALSMQNADISTTPSLTQNTAVGYSSLMGSSNAADNTGGLNTAIGAISMKENTSGGNNTAVGFGSLHNNKTGSSNVAVGSSSLANNINGTHNVAIGVNALQNDIDGQYNVAIGYQAMNLVRALPSPYLTSNTAVGAGALHGSLFINENTGVLNTAIGTFALYSTSSGTNNTAIGYESLANLKTGNDNIAVGYRGLYNNISGSRNVAFGYNAGYNETSSNKLYIENTDADKDNALIYGDFANDSLNLNAKVNIKNFTRLGTQASGAPAIKMKEFTITSAATITGESVPMAHGLSFSKIISVTALMETAGILAPPEYSGDATLRYNFYITGTSIIIRNNASGGTNVISKPVRVLVTYKE